MIVTITNEYQDPIWNSTHSQDSINELFTSLSKKVQANEEIDCEMVVHVTFVTNDSIQQTNKAYRNKDSATDVLSFPSVEFGKYKRARYCVHKLKQEYDDEYNACFIGDVIISIPKMQEQAQTYGHSESRELSYLFVHALLHLLGYDHMEPLEKEEMRQLEEKALQSNAQYPLDEEALMQQSFQAMQFSYSPYSKFKVGAALLTKSGKVYTGCNIENASYGATNCAERTALFKAVSEGEKEFVAIAISAEKAMPWPCGICRQAMLEFAPDLLVIAQVGDTREKMLLKDLLPHGFGPSNGTDEFLGKD